MATTWGSKLLRHQRNADAKLTQSLNGMAVAVARAVLSQATDLNDDGQRVVPNKRAAREALRKTIWQTVLRPYFIGDGEDALDGAKPLSPFTVLMVDGIRGGVRIQAEQQTAIVKKATRRHPVVQDWLIGKRPAWLATEMHIVREQGGGRPFSYDPFHLFVDPSGYRLSDRVWQTSRETRRRIDRLLDYHIPRGTAAVDLAEHLEMYLTPDAMRQQTRTPYGWQGNYSARRLARTEITAAAGRAAVSANLANPFVDGTDWRLSASHPEIDICDELATLDMSGSRKRQPYPNDAVPGYPAHPHELCILIPHVTTEPGAVANEVARRIEAQEPATVQLKGAFNTDWMAEALLFGFFLRSVLGAAAPAEA